MLETHDGRPSSRVKDLVDVVVYAKACAIDGATLANRVAKEAAARKVELPGPFAIPDAWFESYGAAYAKMARQAKVEDVAPDLASAQRLAQGFYAPALAGVSGPAEWSPDDMRWIEE